MVARTRTRGAASESPVTTAAPPARAGRGAAKASPAARRSPRDSPPKSADSPPKTSPQARSPSSSPRRVATSTDKWHQATKPSPDAVSRCVLCVLPPQGLHTQVDTTTEFQTLQFARELSFDRCPQVRQQSTVDKGCERQRCWEIHLCNHGRPLLKLTVGCSIRRASRCIGLERDRSNDVRCDFTHHQTPHPHTFTLCHSAHECERTFPLGWLTDKPTHVESHCHHVRW